MYMEYFIKVHPATLVLLPNNQDPLVFPNHGNIYKSVQALTTALLSLQEPTIILTEKPYLDQHQDPAKIITTQRAYGALLYQLQIHYPSTPIREFTSAFIRKQVLPDTTKPSKDHMLTWTQAKYHTLNKHYTPVQELCIYDTALLQAYYRQLI